MTELPRKAAARTARLAALPLGFAGRNAIGLGKRLGGRPAEAVMLDIQQRTAEQLFRTLGELKGGAMKFGQAMSVLEAALPDELIGPYREHLTLLQDSAPPMPTQLVRDALALTWATTGGNGSSGWTAARPRPLRSGRSTRGAGTTDATSPSRCSTSGPARRCAPTCASWPASPGRSGRWCPASTSSRWSRSSRPDRGARLRARGGGPARVRGGVP